MRLSFKLPAALLGLAALVSASNVIDLDSKNFDQVRTFSQTCGAFQTSTFDAHSPIPALVAFVP